MYGGDRHCTEHDRQLEVHARQQSRHRGEPNHQVAGESSSNNASVDDDIAVAAQIMIQLRQQQQQHQEELETNDEVNDGTASRDGGLCHIEAAQIKIQLQQHAELETDDEVDSHLAEQSLLPDASWFLRKFVIREEGRIGVRLKETPSGLCVIESVVSGSIAAIRGMMPNDVLSKPGTDGKVRFKSPSPFSIFYLAHRPFVFSYSI